MNIRNLTPDEYILKVDGKEFTIPTDKGEPFTCWPSEEGEPGTLESKDFPIKFTWAKGMRISKANLSRIKNNEIVIVPYHVAGWVSLAIPLEWNTQVLAPNFEGQWRNACVIDVESFIRYR